MVRVFPCEKGTTRRTPFWFRLVSTLSLFRLTRFTIGSHLLTFPSSLAPDPPWCWQTRSRLAVESWLTPGYIVLAASHPAITRDAWASQATADGTAGLARNRFLSYQTINDTTLHVALHNEDYHTPKRTFVDRSGSVNNGHFRSFRNVAIKL